MGVPAVTKKLSKGTLSTETFSLACSFWARWRSSIVASTFWRSLRKIVRCASLFCTWPAAFFGRRYRSSAFKRFTRDVGQLILILVVLTDKQPTEAIRRVFARCI